MNFWKLIDRKLILKNDFQENIFHHLFIIEKLEKVFNLENVFLFCKGEVIQKFITFLKGIFFTWEYIFLSKTKTAHESQENVFQKSSKCKKSENQEHIFLKLNKCLKFMKVSWIFREKLQFLILCRSPENYSSTFIFLARLQINLFRSDFIFIHRLIILQELNMIRFFPFLDRYEVRSYYTDNLHFRPC